MMSTLPSVQAFPEIQPPPNNDGETLVELSQPVQHLNFQRLPDELVVRTRGDASQATRFQLVFRLPPSKIVLVQWLAIDQELQELPREAVVQLARQAQGSWKNTKADAVTIVRQLRDEWDSGSS